MNFQKLTNNRAGNGNHEKRLYNNANIINTSDGNNYKPLKP